MWPQVILTLNEKSHGPRVLVTSILSWPGGADVLSTACGIPLTQKLVALGVKVPRYFDQSVERRYLLDLHHHLDGHAKREVQCWRPSSPPRCVTIYKGLSQCELDLRKSVLDALVERPPVFRYAQRQRFLRNSRHHDSCDNAARDGRSELHRVVVD